MIGMAKDVGGEGVLGADPVDGRGRQTPFGIDPVFGDENFMAIPVVDFRCIHGDVRVAFYGGVDDAPGLAGLDGEIVAGIEVAAVDGVLAIIRVADGVLVIDLVASAGEEAAFIHFDDVADPFEHPLDAAIAARFAFFVVDGGDQDVLGADGVGRLKGPAFKANRVLVEVAPVTPTRRFGMGADDVAEGEQVGKIAGIVGDAETAGQEAQARRQKQRQPLPKGKCHSPIHRRHRTLLARPACIRNCEGFTRRIAGKMGKGGGCGHSIARGAALRQCARIRADQIRGQKIIGDQPRWSASRSPRSAAGHFVSVRAGTCRTLSPSSKPSPRSRCCPIASPCRLR